MSDAAAPPPAACSELATEQLLSRNALPTARVERVNGVDRSECDAEEDFIGFLGVEQACVSEMPALRDPSDSPTAVMVLEAWRGALSPSRSPKSRKSG